jgi:hypothetical protein
VLGKAWVVNSYVWRYTHYPLEYKGLMHFVQPASAEEIFQNATLIFYTWNPRNKRISEHKWDNSSLVSLKPQNIGKDGWPITAVGWLLPTQYQIASRPTLIMAHHRTYTVWRRDTRCLLNQVSGWSTRIIGWHELSAKILCFTWQTQGRCVVQEKVQQLR